jgi:hypothetical protein
VALVVGISTGAQAQDWPSRPLRFVVPFPAGGSTDVGARLIGQSAQEPVGGRADAFSQRVHRDFETYARLVKELNIKAAD